MKKRNDGQVSLAAETNEDDYKSLKALCARSIELGDEYWNWPLVGYLTLPSLQRILNFAWINKMQKSSCGSILDFLSSLWFIVCPTNKLKKHPSAIQLLTTHLWV